MRCIILVGDESGNQIASDDENGAVSDFCSDYNFEAETRTNAASTAKSHIPGDMDGDGEDGILLA